jgi:hypothetical protein
MIKLFAIVSLALLTMLTQAWAGCDFTDNPGSNLRTLIIDTTTLSGTVSGVVYSDHACTIPSTSFDYHRTLSGVWETTIDFFGLWPVRFSWMVEKHKQTYTFSGRVLTNGGGPFSVGSWLRGPSQFQIGVDGVPEDGKMAQTGTGGEPPLTIRANMGNMMIGGRYPTVTLGEFAARPSSEFITYEGAIYIDPDTGRTVYGGKAAGSIFSPETLGLVPVSVKGLSSVDDALSRLGSGNFSAPVNTTNTHTLPVSGAGTQIGTSSFWRKLTSSSIADKNVQRKLVSIDFTLCPDAYNITYHYQKSPLGTEDWVADNDLNITEPREVTSNKQFTASHLVKEDSSDYKYAVYKITATSSGCRLAQAGSGIFAVASVHATIPLGRIDALTGAGTLVVDSETINPSLYTTAALKFIGPESASIQLIRSDLSDPSSALRQIRTPQLLANIVTIHGSSHEVRLYHSNQIGPIDTNTDLFTLTGSPFVTHLFENPDASAGLTTRLKVTETRPDKIKSVTYAFDTATSTWSLTEGDGLRVTSIATSTDATTGDATKTTTLKDTVTPAATPADQISSVTARTTRSFPWGLAPVSEVRDPAGAALTTTYTYYGNAATDGTNYAHLKTRQDPNG